MERAADQVVQLFAHPLRKAGLIAFNMQFDESAHHHRELPRSRHGLDVDPRVDITVLLELASQQFSAMFQAGFDVAAGGAAPQQGLQLGAAVRQVATDSWQRTIGGAGPWPGLPELWLRWRDALRGQLEIVVCVLARRAWLRLLPGGWFG